MPDYRGNRKQIYDMLVNNQAFDGDAPSFDEFSEKMKDEGNRRQVHDMLVSNNAFDGDAPSFEQFTGNMIDPNEGAAKVAGTPATKPDGEAPGTVTKGAGGVGTPANEGAVQQPVDATTGAAMPLNKPPYKEPEEYTYSWGETANVGEKRDWIGTTDPNMPYLQLMRDPETDNTFYVDRSTGKPVSESVRIPEKEVSSWDFTDAFADKSFTQQADEALKAKYGAGYKKQTFTDENGNRISGEDMWDSYSTNLMNNFYQKMNESVLSDDNRSKIENLVGDAIAKEEKRSGEIASKETESQKMSTSEMYIPSKEAYFDPAKFADNLDEMKKEILSGAEAHIKKIAEETGVKEEFIRKHIKDYVEGTVAQKTAEFYEAKYGVHSDAEFVVIGALEGSLIGKLARTNVPDAAKYKREEYMQGYAQNAGSLANLSQFGLTLLADTPFFAAFGGVSGFVTRGLPEWKSAGKIIDALVEKGLSREAAMSTYKAMYATHIGTRLTNDIFKRVASSALTLGQYEGMGSVLDGGNYFTGVTVKDPNTGKEVKQGGFWHGAKTGAAFGIVNHVAHGLTYGLEGGAKVLGFAGSLTGEAATLTAMDDIDAYISGKKNIGDFLFETAENLPQAFVMRYANGEIFHNIQKLKENIKNGFRNVNNPLELNADNYRELKEQGFDLTTMFVEPMNTRFYREGVKTDEAKLNRELAEAMYKSVLADPNISLATKHKVEYLFGGKMTYANADELSYVRTPMMDGRIKISTKNGNDEVISVKYFSNPEDANRYEQQLDKKFEADKANADIARTVVADIVQRGRATEEELSELLTNGFVTKKGKYDEKRTKAVADEMKATVNRLAKGIAPIKHAQAVLEGGSDVGVDEVEDVAPSVVSDAEIGGNTITYTDADGNSVAQEATGQEVAGQREDGGFQRAIISIDGNPVEMLVKSGDIVMTEDGRVDKARTSDVLYFVDAEGAVHPIAKEKLNVVGLEPVMTASEYFATKTDGAAEGAGTPAAEEGAAENGSEMQELGAGQLMHETGKELNAEWHDDDADEDGKGTFLIKEGQNEDGTYNVVVFDETTGETYTARLSAEDINAMVTDEPTVMPGAAEGAYAPAEGEGAAEIGSEMQNQGAGMQPMEGAAEGVGTPAAEGAGMPVEQSVEAVVPRTQAQQTYDAIAQEWSYVKDATERQKSIVGDINATIEGVKRKMEKVAAQVNVSVDLTDAKAVQKRSQARAELQQMQQTLDFWNEVKGEYNAQMQKAMAERAAKEAAEAAEFERRKAELAAQKMAEEEAAKAAAAAGAGPIERKWNAAPKYEGRKKTINLPDGTTLSGHYVLTTAGAATASHDPFRNYASSEGFPTDESGNNVNDRDYQGDATQRKETELQAAQYDGRAIDSMPVVSKRGIVYSGNGRTMAGDIAARNNTDAAYVEQLRADADMYGFTPEQVAEMGEHPRLVFVPEEELPYTTATFAKFNVKAEKGQGNTAKAVKASKQLSEQDVQTIVGIMAGVDGEGGYANIDSFFSSEKGTNDLILALQERGILQSNEVADYVEDGKFNNAGKDFVKNLLLGTMFDADAIKVISTVPSVKNALVSAMNPLLENTRLGDYSTKAEISNAARLIAEAKAKGYSSVADYMRQTSLFGQGADQYTDFEKALAVSMDGGVESFRKQLGEYNKTAAMEKDGSIFGAMTPEEVKAAFVDSFNNEEEPMSQFFIKSDRYGLQRGNRDGNGADTLAAVPRRTQDLLDTIGKQLGYTISVEDFEQEGMTEPWKRKITLSLEHAVSKPEKVMHYILGHELTHTIKSLSKDFPELWDAYLNCVKKAMTEEEFEAEAQQIMDTYNRNIERMRKQNPEKWGHVLDITIEAAREEVASNFAGEHIFTDKEFVKDMLDEVAKSSESSASIARRVLNYISNLLKRIKSAVKDRFLTAEENRMLHALEGAKQLWKEMYKYAAAKEREAAVEPVDEQPKFSMLPDSQSNKDEAFVRRNIESGMNALRALANGETSVRGAMNRPELADLGGTSEITIDWGTQGKITPDGRYKGGSGLLKIIDKHGVGEAIEMVNTIARGEIGTPYGPERGKRVNILNEDRQAVISLYRNNAQESWVITAYKNESNADAKGRGSDLNSATLSDPIRTRAELVAALDSFGQANKNGGELVILSSKDRVGSLSTPLTGLSSGSKSTKNNSLVQENGEKSAVSPQIIDVQERKNLQFGIIEGSNPHNDELGEHTWIRKPEDIKTFDEVLSEWGDDDIAPDYTIEDARKAAESGEITVYSSKPVEAGNFVTPSEMEAKSYAGGGRVYSTTVRVEDVAWIDAIEGQYAKVEDNAEKLSFSIQNLERELENETSPLRQAILKAKIRNLEEQEVKFSIQNAETTAAANREAWEKAKYSQANPNSVVLMKDGGRFITFGSDARKVARDLGMEDRMNDGKLSITMGDYLKLKDMKRDDSYGIKAEHWSDWEEWQHGTPDAAWRGGKIGKKNAHELLKDHPELQRERDLIKNAKTAEGQVEAIDDYVQTLSDMLDGEREDLTIMQGGRAAILEAISEANEMREKAEDVGTPAEATFAIESWKPKAKPSGTVAKAKRAPKSAGEKTQKEWQATAPSEEKMLQRPGEESMGEYYDDDNQALAHAVKRGEKSAIKEAARRMALWFNAWYDGETVRYTEDIGNNYSTYQWILVPVPSHGGKATYTKKLAEEISKITGIPVADALSAKPHKSAYESKAMGEQRDKIEPSVNWDAIKAAIDSKERKSVLTKNPHPVLIDNVRATGETLDIYHDALSNKTEQKKAGLDDLNGVYRLTLTEDNSNVWQIGGKDVLLSGEETWQAHAASRTLPVHPWTYYDNYTKRQELEERFNNGEITEEEYEDLYEDLITDDYDSGVSIDNGWVVFNGYGNKPGTAVDPEEIKAIHDNPWQNVQEATVHSSNIRKRFPQLHESAKHGDVMDAAMLVDKVVDDMKIAQLQAKYPEAIVAYPHAEDRRGRNAIPSAFADKFADAGFEVDDVIVQANRVYRTDANKFDRLIKRARFDGEVQAGREYILIDDHITSGATMRDMKDYIESKGGKVVAVQALEGSAGATKMALTPELKEQLINNGVTDEQLKELGISRSVENLTAGEARELLTLSKRGRDFRTKEQQKISSRRSQKSTRRTPEEIARAERSRADSERARVEAEKQSFDRLFSGVKPTSTDEAADLEAKNSSKDIAERILRKMQIPEEKKAQVKTGTYQPKATAVGKKKAKPTTWVQLELDFKDEEEPKAKPSGTVAEAAEGVGTLADGGTVAEPSGKTEGTVVAEKTPEDFHLRPLKEGETCLVERRYVENGSFGFTGSEKIESPDDVAYIFRNLEDSAIENAFFALVKDGKATIIHAGMGAMDFSATDHIAPKLAIDNIDPDAIYFLHNHPSGNLKPSIQDKELYTALKEMYGDKLLDGIIIDQKSGKYATFNLWDSSERIRPTSAASDVPYKTYSFSKNVFAPDYSFEEGNIVYPNDIAAFVSSHRLGDRGKLGVLICNNNHVNGNIFLDVNEINGDNYVKIAKDIVSACAAMSGRLAYVHGSGNITYRTADMLNMAIRKLSGRRFRLNDVVTMDGNNEDSWQSVFASEPEPEYGKNNGEEKADSHTPQLQPSEESQANEYGNPWTKVEINSENRKEIEKNVADLQENYSKGTPKEFLQSIRKALLTDSSDHSGYSEQVIGGEKYTLRISDHYANSKHNKNNKQPIVDGIVIKIEKGRFRAHKDVKMIERVFFVENLTDEKRKDIVAAIQEWVNTGKITNLSADVVHESPKSTVLRSEINDLLREAEQETSPLRRAILKAKARNLYNEAIAKAEGETELNPTDAQKEAGNYKKGHLRIDGYDISIENPKGSTRSGKDADGKAWSVTMRNTYGYIRGTEGVDGDHIDIYLSDNPFSGNVFVIDQVNADGSFDEHKVMYGFETAEEARENYLANYSEGWTGLGTITEVTKEEFQKWVKSSHRKTKPFAEYKSVKAEGAQHAGIGEAQPLFAMVQEADPFYSNAAKAVEDIKQEKATPEQWLKMIEKAGGLKKGEDKWMGLSEWLKERAKLGAKTLSKDEVMEYIRQNTIQIEEVEYTENANDVTDNPRMHELQKEYEKYYSESNGDEETAFQKMVDNHGDDFSMGFYTDGDTLYAEQSWDGEPNEYAIGYLGIPENPINGTRLQYTTKGLENKKEIALTVPTIEPYGDDDEVHFGDAGGGRAVAWVRFGDARDGDGSRVLVIDEIQSRRHQDGREQGYFTPEMREAAKRDYESLRAELESNRKEILDLMENPDIPDGLKDGNPDYYGLYEDEIPKELYKQIEDAYAKEDEIRAKLREINALRGVPDAPFDKNWHELAMKRMLRYAAENGYDKVAWTTGMQQAERYNMTKVLNGVELLYSNDGERVYDVTENNGGRFRLKVDNEGKVIESTLNGVNQGVSLSDVMGKELATKMSELDVNDENEGMITFDDLAIGGEGMKGFYDQILPKFMQKYGKKWGAKVGEVELDLPNSADRKMWSVDVTPEMKESVMQGQPMFSMIRNAPDTGSLSEGWEDPEIERNRMTYLQRLEEAKNEANIVLTRLGGVELSAQAADAERKNKLLKPEQQSEARKAVANFVNAALSTDNMSVFSKRALKGISSKVAEAKTTRMLRKHLMEAETICNDAEVARLKMQIDKLLKMKVQDMNDKGLSVGKLVDDETRKVFEYMKGRTEELRRTEVDDELKAVGAELREIEEIIKNTLYEHMIGDAKTREDRNVLVDANPDLTTEYDGEQHTLAELKAMTESLIEHQKELKEQKAEIQAGNRDNLANWHDRMNELQYRFENSEEEGVKPLSESEKREYEGLMILDAINEADKLAYTTQVREDGQLQESVKSIKDQKNELFEKNRQLRLQLGENYGRDDIYIKREISQNNNLIDNLTLAENAIKEQQIDFYRQAADAMKELIQNGMSKLMEQKEAEKERKDYIGMMGYRDVKKGNEWGEGQKQKTGWNTVKDFLFLSPLQSFEFMSQWVSNMPAGRGYLYNYFTKNLVKAEEQLATSVDRDTQILNDKCQELFGCNFKQASERYGRSPWHPFRKYNSGVYVMNEDGSSMVKDDRYTDMPKGTALQFWMWWQNPDGRMKMQAMGFNEESIQQIENYCGPKLLEFGQWLFSFYEEMGDRVNEVHKMLYNTSMRRVPNYSPLKINDTQIAEKNDLASGDNAFSKSLNKINGSLINRTVNTLPLSTERTAFDIVAEHMNANEELIAFGRVRKDLDYLLNSMAFRNTLNANKSGNYNDFMKAAMTAAHLTSESFEGSDRVYGAIMSGFAAGAIGYRIWTGIKQVMSYPAFYAYKANPRYWADVTARFWSILEAKPTLIMANVHWASENLPLFKARWNEGLAGNQDVVREVETLDNQTMWGRIRENYGKYGMLWNRFVDAMTCAAGARAIYDFEYRRRKKYYLSCGRDEQRAHELANSEALECANNYNTTQQSSVKTYISPEQDSKTALNRVIGLFQNSNRGFSRQGYLGAKDMLGAMSGKKRTYWVQRYMDNIVLTKEQSQGKTEEEKTKLRKSMAEKMLAEDIATAVGKFAMCGFGIKWIWDRTPKIGKATMLAGMSPAAPVLGGAMAGTMIGASVGSKAKSPVIGAAAGGAAGGALGFALGGSALAAAISAFIKTILEDDDEAGEENNSKVMEILNEGAKWASYFPQGTFGGNFAHDGLWNHSIYDPFSIVGQSEMESIKKAYDKYGWSPEVAAEIMRRVPSVQGFNMDTYTNIYIGAKDLIDNGYNAHVAIDVMLMLNCPASMRKDVASTMYKDYSLQEYTAAMVTARKLADRGKFFGQFTGTHDVNRNDVSEINEEWMKNKLGADVVATFKELNKQDGLLKQIGQYQTGMDSSSGTNGMTETEREEFETAHPELFNQISPNEAVTFQEHAASLRNVYNKMKTNANNAKKLGDEAQYQKITGEQMKVMKELVNVVKGKIDITPDEVDAMLDDQLEMADELKERKDAARDN